jgi:ankyrin repeat protein
LSRENQIRSKSLTIGECTRYTPSSQDMNGKSISWYQTNKDVLSLVRYIVDRCPLVIQIADRSGRQPLHVAAARGDAVWPELLQLLANRSESEPIHVAPAREDAQWQVLLQLFVRANIQRLLRDNVPPVRQDNASRLHRDSLSHLRRESAKRLERDNDPCLHRDNTGRLPLHLAVLAPRVSWPAVEALAQLCPDSLQERDINGSNPFHLATLRHAPLDLLYRLLLLYPSLLDDK